MRQNPKKVLNRSNSSATNISYHIVWTTKYRKKLLSFTIQEKLKSILYSTAFKINVNIKALEIMPDHVHIFLQSKPNISVSFIVKNLKGSSSFYLRQSFFELNKYKTLWTPSYYCESIGHINESTVIKYINDQKK